MLLRGPAARHDTEQPHLWKANWDPNQTNRDESFEFLMPSTYPSNVALPVVVHTQYGVSNADQSIIVQP